MNFRCPSLARLLAALVVVFLLFSGALEDQPLPKSVAIGSNPPGSLFYALASGLAKVVSDSAAP